MSFSDDPTPGYLLQMLLNLPANMHIMVRHTAVVLIGDLSHWVSHHQEFLGLYSIISFLFFSTRTP